MTRLNEQLAGVGGGAIQYRVAGAGEPMVLRHGAGGFRLDQPTFGGRAARYTLFVPWMPGFDRSTPGAATSLLDVAHVMAEFIRVVAGSSASVIGESFGGGVAAVVVDRATWRADPALGSFLAPQQDDKRCRFRHVLFDVKVCAPTRRQPEPGSASLFWRCPAC